MPKFSFIRVYAVVCVFMVSLSGYAQNTPGARTTAMGGSAILNEDVWSGFHNQAGLVHLEGVSAGAFYENRFTISELSDKGALVAMPLGNSSFALSYRSFGYSAFSNSKAGLAYALKLNEKFSFGLQFNYHSVRIADNYGSTNNISFEGGFLYRYNTKLSLAAHVTNPTRAQIADFNNERIPSIIRIGAGYKFTDKVILNAEVKKPSNTDISVHSGLEYWVANQIALRVGFNTLNTFSFGFGWKAKSLQVDAAASFNSVLGFTPHISLTYSGKKG